MARSQAAQQRIDVIKRVNYGKFPLFIQLAHKSLEKSQPTGVESNGETAFVVPKDIVKLALSDPALADSIESIEFRYKQTPATTETEE